MWKKRSIFHPSIVLEKKCNIIYPLNGIYIAIETKTKHRPKLGRTFKNIGPNSCIISKIIIDLHVQHSDINSHQPVKYQNICTVLPRLRDIDQISECETDFLDIAAAVAWKIYVQHVNWKRRRDEKRRRKQSTTQNKTCKCFTSHHHHHPLVVDLT